MSILQLDAARAHCRLEPDYPDAQLQPYVDGAQAYVVAHLNRAVFETQDAMDAALAALPAAMADAYTAYSTAIDGAAAIQNPDERQTTIDVAESKYAAARLAGRRATNGIVVNASISAAMLLTLGNLFANREADVVGAPVSALPLGVRELLRPYRLVQMP